MRNVFLLLACLAIVAQAEISIKTAVVSIEESDGVVADADRVTLAFKDALQTPLKLDHTQKLKITFAVSDPSGAPIQPDQAFLRLFSSQSNRAAYVAAAPAKKGDALEISATSAGIEDQIGAQGGPFEATLIIGSVSPSAALQWPLGVVTVTHRPGPDGNQPPAPRTRMEVETSPKPEIVHVFRVPVKPAPTLASLAFTGIAVLPLAAFIIGAGFVGANFSAFPKTGIEWVYAIGFHGGIAALLVLYVLFWLKLNLLQTLPFALIFEVVTLGFGLKAAAAAEAAAQVVSRNSDKIKSN